jgi:hypothetical protein
MTKILGNAAERRPNVSTAGAILSYSPVGANARFGDLGKFPENFADGVQQQARRRICSGFPALEKYRQTILLSMSGNGRTYRAECQRCHARRIDRRYAMEAGTPSKWPPAVRHAWQRNEAGARIIGRTDS